MACHRPYEPVIERAAQLGIGVVAMCPVAGGVLSFPSDTLRDEIGLDIRIGIAVIRTGALLDIIRNSVAVGIRGHGGTAQDDRKAQTQ